MGAIYTTAAGTEIMLSSVAAIAGGALAAGSFVMQGQAANAASKTQAELYRRQAERERQLGDIAATRKRQEGERLAGMQRAQMAGRGQDASTGSALLVQEDLAEETEFNALILENNAEADRTGLMAQGIMARAAGKNEMLTSSFRAGSALLSTGKAFA